MRTALAALGVLCFMGSCSSGMTSSKGIVCDATMNTVAIVIDKNDTLEVFYAGKYTPGMQASKLVQYPQSPKLGGDRDEHGCIGSAGYVWCEVQQDCIRLFEKGIRTEAVDGSTASAFIVFSSDSTRLELFFSDDQPNEILERRGLPSGGYAWNVEDDDTKNVRFVDGVWTISQRNKLIYSQKAGN